MDHAAEDQSVLRKPDTDAESGDDAAERSATAPPAEKGETRQPAVGVMGRRTGSIQRNNQGFQTRSP